MDITTTARSTTRLLLALALVILPISLPAQSADGPADIASALSPRVLFMVSGGFWQEEIASEGSPKAERGYFRAVAIRSADNTSRLFLQRIRLDADGPVLVETSEIESLSSMRVYVTDVRPESSSGVAEQPGFAAFIYLKENPTAGEPDTYELFVDEFGDVSFAPATN